MLTSEQIAEILFDADFDSINDAIEAWIERIEKEMEAK